MFSFSIQLGMSSSQVTNCIIFQRGFSSTTNQRVFYPIKSHEITTKPLFSYGFPMGFLPFTGAQVGRLLQDDRPGGRRSLQDLRRLRGRLRALGGLRGGASGAVMAGKQGPLGVFGGDGFGGFHGIL